MPPRHLYVHVPFCARRCAYCDFSIAVRRATPVDEYMSGLRAELAMVSAGMPTASDGGWLLDTVYLGGGTPSRLGAALPRVIDSIREMATIAADAEVTVEANPEDVTAENAAAWKLAGANRISLGSQSFDPKVLSWMHRVHSAEQIGFAVGIARQAGFDNISVDLIFALPKSLGRDWKRDLEHAVALEPEHISLYGLTVEPKTPLARWRDRGEMREAGDDAYATEFMLAHETLAAAGFDHYEVSNFGIPGRHSRHNSAYWSGADYIGIGPSAHSFDGARRWWNVAPYAEWSKRLAARSSPVDEVEVLDEENISNEKVYLGLRTQYGVRVEAGELVDLQPWVDAGWAGFSQSAAHPEVSQTAPVESQQSEERRLRLTPNGWLLLDELAASLTWIRSRSYV